MATTVTLQTMLGQIVIELFTDEAPETTANFIQYVEDGHYDGTIFHRVINDFMIQGGGFDEEFNEKETRATIKNEAENRLSNEVGTVAMARLPDPHSASAQFFINLKDNNFLDFKSATSQGYGYCVFGKVIEGMDVVDAMKEAETGNKNGHSDVPIDNIVIDSATVSK